MGSPECLAVKLTVRPQWAHCYHCMVSSLVDLTNSSQQAQGVSYKLMESSHQAHSMSHLVRSLWVHCEVTVSVLKMSPPWVSMLAPSWNTSLGKFLPVSHFIQNQEKLSWSLFIEFVMMYPRYTQKTHPWKICPSWRMFMIINQKFSNNQRPVFRIFPQEK